MRSVHAKCKNRVESAFSKSAKIVQLVQKVHVSSQSDEFLEEHNRGTGHESGGGCNGGSTVHISFGFSGMSNDDITMCIGNSISCSDRIF